MDVILWNPSCIDHKKLIQKLHVTLVDILYIEHHHSCTVHARLYISGKQAQTIAEFSVDLVSPVEYLFKKFSANDLGKA